MTLDAFKGMVADLARPFSIIATSAAAAWATVTIAHKVQTFEGGATFIAAVYVGLAGLYGWKSWEQAKAGQHSAEVEKAKASTVPQPGTATIVTSPDVDVTVREADPSSDPAMFGGPRL